MTFWKKFFMIIGIIASILAFLLIIAAVIGYFIFFAPNKPSSLETGKEKQAQTTEVKKEDAKAQVDEHPLLSETQEKTLKTFGVDVSELPTEIDNNLETCATDLLGEERVAEIIAGDTPSLSDILKAKKCF